MRRIVLAFTVAAALGFVGTAGMLMPPPLKASNAVKVGDSETKGPASTRDQASASPVVAQSDRSPVPIVRKPAVPSTTDGVALSSNSDIQPIPDIPSNTQPNDRNFAGRPAPPALPPPRNVTSLANGDYDEKSEGSAVPFSPGAARRQLRIVVSRGNQGDYVVIPVERHMVVIHGWRLESEGKRRGNDRDDRY